MCYWRVRKAVTRTIPFHLTTRPYAVKIMTLCILEIKLLRLKEVQWLGLGNTAKMWQRHDPVSPVLTQCHALFIFFQKNYHRIPLKIIHFNTSVYNNLIAKQLLPEVTLKKSWPVFSLSGQNSVNDASPSLERQEEFSEILTLGEWRGGGVSMGPQQRHKHQKDLDFSVALLLIGWFDLKVLSFSNPQFAHL